MSPVPAFNVSVPSSVPTQLAPAFPVFDNWLNPLPSNFKELDGRRHYLQSRNHRFLEMHPNGTRGVENKTDYCILTIMLYTITNHHLHSLPGSQGASGPQDHQASGLAQHIIVGNKTGLYLCMDDKSVLFQSRTFNETLCLFRNEPKADHSEMYYRQKTPEAEKWYIGLNRDGTVRCGNTTKRKQKGVNFIRISAGDIEKHTASPPFVEHKKECCKTNKCKRNKTGKNTPRRRKGSRCYKNWCKKHRRRFFALKLKDLKRYYTRCIKKNSACHKRGER